MWLHVEHSGYWSSLCLCQRNQTQHFPGENKYKQIKVKFKYHIRYREVDHTTVLRVLTQWNLMFLFILSDSNPIHTSSLYMAYAPHQSAPTSFKWLGICWSMHQWLGTLFNGWTLEMPTLYIEVMQVLPPM